MQNSNEIRKLAAKWTANTGWPKRLEWLRITGIRGWVGTRFDLKFPIMAVVGENGVGKSTLLQGAAAVYKSPQGKGHFASDFFPDTHWEKIRQAEIEYSVRERDQVFTKTIRKPTDRWRGNPDRRERPIVYVDLSRIQPVPARVGYTKLVKAEHHETGAEIFDKTRLSRLSQVMGRTYDLARMALTNVHATRAVPVISQHGTEYSGFHQGAGETTVTELLKTDWPQYSIVLIDEIETSLHPRAQRRLIRDIADKCREREIQVVLTTHSPYILDELPPEARAHVMEIGGTREIVYGVSSAFAMTKMDEVAQPECDLYVEDLRAKDFLVEIIVAHGDPEHMSQRCRVIPYGASSVGQALGQMVAKNRFPEPACVFLDGDQSPARGCILLPGDDAPERVVFEGLKAENWTGIPVRVGRDFTAVADACTRAMALGDHHAWLEEAARPLTLRTDNLWQAMCAEWAKRCLAPEDAAKIIQPIEAALLGFKPESSVAHERKAPPVPVEAKAAPQAQAKPLPKASSARPSTGTLPLFEQFFDAGEP